ncbi:MAG: Fic family protein [Prevotella sp.]|nr:Fic family protein [Prevotella sp.]
MKYNGYIPPFTISTEAINLIAKISAQIERYAIRMEQEDALKLRKANRVKTIHSSLAIEGNTLSEEEVRDIINGKNVVAPIKQIQEVKNAIAAYELYSQLDAFKEKDLLKAHGVMMSSLVDNPGKYRTQGVGVFSEHGLVHMAPPAERVPALMSELFGWLKKADDHLLVRSCVFHYEFEFIHPFIDGNGRIGRLWQSLILGKLHPIFEHLPVENMVYSNQQNYYDAITQSSNIGNSGPFIDFMLGEIYKTLREHQGSIIERVPNKVPKKVPKKLVDTFPDIPVLTWEIYAEIKKNVKLTNMQLSTIFGISDRMVRKHINTLKSYGLISRIGANRNGYWKVNG